MILLFVKAPDVADREVVRDAKFLAYLVSGCQGGSKSIDFYRVWKDLKSA